MLLLQGRVPGRFSRIPGVDRQNCHWLNACEGLGGFRLGPPCFGDVKVLVLTVTPSSGQPGGQLQGLCASLLIGTLLMDKTPTNLERSAPGEADRKPLRAAMKAVCAG